MEVFNGTLESRVGAFSYQSLMPDAAGTPRYENWVHWLVDGSGVVCATHPAPSWGQAPALHFSLPAGNEPQLEEVSRPAILVPMTSGNSRVRRHEENNLFSYLGRRAEDEEDSVQRRSFVFLCFRSLFVADEE